jgi:anti-sigma regulatory factor (Ser/Thr protein kinase)
VAACVSTRADAFHHQALLYRNEHAFTSGVTRFVCEGLDAGDAVAVAVPEHNAELLRDALDDVDAMRVSFIDIRQLAKNPGRIINRWHRLATEHAGSGGGFRGVTEPAWPGRRAPEFQECVLHEHLLNAVFANGPAWQLMCPYDAAGRPAAVLSGVNHTHPWHIADDDGHKPEARHNDKYVPGGALGMFSAPLGPPPEHAKRMIYRSSADLALVRRTVESFTRGTGLDAARVADLCLATDELATNSLRHGGGQGVLTLWREPDSLVVQVSDRGHITDPLVGRRAPSGDVVAGRGLYLSYQLCDLLQLRSSREGTVGRLTTWL